MVSSPPRTTVLPTPAAAMTHADPALIDLAARTAQPGWATRLGDLTKVRLNLLVLWTTAVGFVVALASSYLSNLVLSPGAVDPGTFVRSIIFSVSPVDLINFLSKTILPALFTGAICCSQGLRVQTSLTEVPKATKRAVALSVRALFSISALVSLLTYM